MKPLSEALIRVENFHKSFGSKKVHNGVDFHLHSDEVVSIIGGSGTGKSVLMRALIGLEKADQGTIYYKGHDVTNLSEEQWYEVRKNVAYVFQGGALFDSLTVEENLLYPLDAHSGLSAKEKKRRIDETLESFGLPGVNELLPSDLSGGMQKRVGLARATILGPEIILYDEPTAGLDPYNTKNIQKFINKLKDEGKAGILVTHDMPTVYATSERVNLLLDGKIAVDMKVSELKKDDSVIQTFIEGEEYGKTK